MFFEARNQTTPQTQTLNQMVPGILVDRVLLLDGAVDIARMFRVRRTFPCACGRTFGVRDRAGLPQAAFQVAGLTR